MRLLAAGQEFRINVDEILYTQFDGAYQHIHFKQGAEIVLTPEQFKDFMNNKREADDPWP